jgi:hypothetical protein
MAALLQVNPAHRRTGGRQQQARVGAQLRCAAGNRGTSGNKVTGRARTRHGDIIQRAA